MSDDIQKAIEELKEKLTSEIEETDWAPLKQHYEHGGVFIVGEGVDLVEAAIAIAQDKVEFIKLWLESGALRKPTEEEVQEWDANKNIKLARFVIVQPYVLIDLIR
jgi:hypothetical protein